MSTMTTTTALTVGASSRSTGSPELAVGLVARSASDWDKPFSYERSRAGLTNVSTTRGGGELGAQLLDERVVVERVTDLWCRFLGPIPRKARIDVVVNDDDRTPRVDAGSL